MEKKFASGDIGTYKKRPAAVKQWRGAQVYFQYFSPLKLKKKNIPFLFTAQNAKPITFY